MRFNSFNEVIAWSILSLRPVIAYVPRADSYLCIWHSTIFTLASVQAAAFVKIEVSGFPSRSIGKAVGHDLDRLCKLDLFKTAPFTISDGIRDENQYLTYVIKEIYLLMDNHHIEENYSKEEIILFFSMKDPVILDV